MTPGDGSSSDMYRFAIDDADSTERLMTGPVDIADAPPPYRAVARTLRALREAPDSWDLAGERDAVEQIAAAVMLERKARPLRHPRWRSVRMAALAATAVVACALPLVGGLASAGALPEPAQNVASTVLGKVGISLPTGAEAPPDNGPPPASPVPAPSSTTGTSPGVGESNTGARGPAPDAGKRAPESSSPTAPDNGEGHQHGTGSHGTPRDNKDNGANKDGGGAHSQDGGDGGSGSDHTG
jgi:hypothetical protein